MNVILYKSATCPQCKVVQMKLEKKQIPFTKQLVEDMTSEELAEKEIRGIPTLFVDGEKISNLRKICEWIEKYEV